MGIHKGASFCKAVELVLVMEGGYVNDPKDPGGETNFGISKRSYPNVCMKTITKEDAIEIYREDYWKKCKCDDLPSELRLMVFDCAVNQGVGFASKTLQRIVKAKPDGIIGPNTLSAIGKFEVKHLVEKYAIKRLERYMRNVNFDLYGKGWLQRLTHVTVHTK